MADGMNDVLRFQFDRRGFKKPFTRQAVEDAYIAKAGVIQTYWDPDLCEGKGDINFVSWPVENFYFDPMFEDIQESRALIKAVWYPESWFMEHYPEAAPYVQLQDAGASGNRPAYMSRIRSSRRCFWSTGTGNTTRKPADIPFTWRKSPVMPCFIPLSGSSPRAFTPMASIPFVIYNYRNLRGSPVGRSMVDDFINVERTFNQLAKYIVDNARAVCQS